MAWVCNNCYSEMGVTKERRNRYRVECPNCGTYWYIDKNDEFINDGSAWYANPDFNEAGSGDNDHTISVYDAALIWRSKGCDEEYTFGYTEEELNAAL